MKMRKLICYILTLVLALTIVTVPVNAGTSYSAKISSAKCVRCDAVQVTCKEKAGATSYQFYVSKKKRSGYKLFAEQATRTATAYGLNTEKYYYFKVRTVNKSGDAVSYSKFSKYKRCKTKFKKPGLSVTGRSYKEVFINVSGTAGASGHYIYRSKYKNKKFKLIKKVAGSSTFSDLSIAPSTTYYYKVKAYRGNKKSQYSKVTKVRTPAWPGDGNGSKYNIDNIGKLADNKLTGRSIFFLGSSVTYGSASGGVSFVDYIAKRNGATVWKEAVSGTTMTDDAEGTGYVQRLKNRVESDKSINPDIFACQLSLNDANRLGVELGELADIDQVNAGNIDLNALDTKTVAGAIEYITAFAYQHWPDCQVVFYTIRNNGYNDRYPQMRKLLYQVQAEWNADGVERIRIIDIWNESAITNLSGNAFILYMADANHPKKAGYLEQWTPIFEKYLRLWMPAKHMVLPENELETITEEQIVVDEQIKEHLEEEQIVEPIIEQEPAA